MVGKWHVFPDSSKACFWLNSMAMNLSDHQVSCRTHDGYLAYISDTEVFSTVFDLLYYYGYVHLKRWLLGLEHYMQIDQIINYNNTYLYSALYDNK